MTDKHVQAEAPHSNMEKDPSTWVTGDEPMTGAQKSYLKTLSEEAGTDFDESLTKAEASEQIDALQQETGRGASGHGPEHAAGKSVPRHTAASPPPRRHGGEQSSHEASRSTEDGRSDQPEGDLFEAHEGAASGAAR